MAFPHDYWQAYEHDVTDLGEFVDAVQKIAAFQTVTGSRFVWRGVANSEWALYSPLVRRYKEVNGSVPGTESQLRAFEAAVLTEARDWGLDWHASGGRLAALEMLAALQHYGVPTRMLDFSFNPLVALWFAAETVPDDDGPMGRVFAIDIAGRGVTRERAAQPEPWWLDIPERSDTEWTTQSWIWRPPPLESRIVRQDGCFLMGGMPSTIPVRSLNTRPLRADEIRSCMSVPFTLVKYDQAIAASEGRSLRGVRPRLPAFTLRVASKPTLRAELEQAFSYSFGSLFPDFAGLAAYGRSFRPAA
jgi:hypothetical protein